MRNMSSNEFVTFPVANDIMELNMFPKKVGHPADTPCNRKTDDHPEILDDEYWEKLNREYEMSKFGRIAMESDAMDSQIDFLMPIQNT